MNEFIEVTVIEVTKVKNGEIRKVNRGKSITINTNNIIYFKPFAGSNKTTILINGLETPFIVEECYEKVKSLIYSGDSATYNEIINHEDKKLNVIKSDYRTTVKEYLEDDNTVCVDYKDLNYDNYTIAYKNFLMTHPVFISNDDEIIGGHIKLAKSKDQLNIVMYMIDINRYIYNMIDYDYYIGRRDILSVYLNDLITRRAINGDYELIVEFPESIIKNETEDNKASKMKQKIIEDNKELNIIKGGIYKSTLGKYIECNDCFLDYRRLINDRDYRIAYKSLLRTHIFRISDEYYTEKSIGYLNLKTFKDNSVIVIYMTNAYDEIYNDIYYNESDYIGCDIIAKYLKDCVNRKNIIGNYVYKDYKLDVCLKY